MIRQLSFLLSAMVLCAASLPLGAQVFHPKNIVFNGAPEYSNEELLATAGLRKGITLTVAEMKDHFQRLNDTGVFESLKYKFDGVDLIYDLTPAENMFPIRLENLPLAAGRELDAQLHSRLPLYHGKVPGEGSLLDGVCRALEEMLAAQGIKASVTAEPFASLGSKKVSAMSFAITDPAMQVGAIHLEGVSPALQKATMNIANHATGAPFFTDGSVENLVHAFESFYVDEGYAAVKVHAVRSGDPVVTAKSIDLPFSVVVEEGHLYKLGQLRLPPDSPVTAADLEKAVAAQKAIAASAGFKAKGLTLGSALSLLSFRYKSKGYLDVAVTAHPEFDEAAGVVNYTIGANPGPVYHLGLIKFDNVDDQLRSRLMRSWQMMPGDPFDQSYVSNFIENAEKDDPALMRTLVGLKVDYDVRADPQTHGVNCVIRLERK